ncbi:MAG: dihydropyrimidinase [Dethiobacteria bacterium]|nr:dihydropyrimidinase [Bacillota bacterium]
MRTIIKNGTVVTTSENYKADILVENETIVAIEAKTSASADLVIDAAGKLVFPGAIDVHTHFDMPFGGTVTADDFTTGTIAAAAGGTTCIIDYALQTPGKSLEDALQVWHARAEGKCAIDYGFHVAVTDLNDAVLNEIPGLIEKGYPSFKVFMAYKGVFQVDDATLLRVLKKSGEAGGLVLVHAENGDVIDVLTKEMLANGQTSPLYHALSRPPQAEEEAVNRYITMAALAGAPAYIVHLSDSSALGLVAEARLQGMPIYAETCPQYLFLALDRYNEPDFGGAKYVMSPPLREAGNNDFLWSGLDSGNLQVVASDHCSFNLKNQKELGRDDFTKIPNGAPGVETRVQLLFAGGVLENRISINKFVDLVSTAPARLFGLYPQKGTIAVGSEADLVVFDPEAPFTISAKTHHQNVDYNPYEGFTGRGVPVKVMSRGTVVIDDGRYVGKAGHGRFQTRKPFNAL